MADERHEHGPGLNVLRGGGAPDFVSATSGEGKVPSEQGEGGKPLRILIVAYYFPPTGGGGVARPLSWVRHWRRLGAEVAVVAAESPPDMPRDDTRATDPALANLAILRVPEWGRPESGRSGALGAWGDWGTRAIRQLVGLPLPDSVGPWAMRAVVAARAFFPEADVVVSTSPPPGAHVAGMMLAAQRGIPWVADFRDPMVNDPSNVGSWREWLKRPARRGWERLIAERATRLVQVSAEAAADLKARLPMSAAQKIVVIPNGFEGGSALPVASSLPGSPFVMVHAGQLGGVGGDKRTLVPLWAALDQLDLTRPDLTRLLRVDLYGQVADSEIEAARHWLDRDQVRLLGQVSWAEAVTAQRRADAILVVNTIPREEYGHLVVGGKVYEALGLGRPVLALTQAGATSRVIEECRAGLWADFHDVDAVGMAVGRLIDAREQGDPLDGADPRLATRYDRAKQAADYLVMLEALVEPRNRR